MSFLKQFDAYPKTHDDYKVKTSGGATITLVSAILIVVLLVSEISHYLKVETEPTLVVNISDNQKMRINFNITFETLPCEYVSVDVMDVSGAQQTNIDHNIFKVRLNKNGEVIDNQPTKQSVGEESEHQKKSAQLPPDYCGSCYGATPPQSGCCQTCNEVQEAYSKMGWALHQYTGIEQCEREGLGKSTQASDEGCNIYGHVFVNKVAGNFHIAPGKSTQHHNMHVHDIFPFLSNSKISFSHTIHRLSFGEEFPEIVNPLDGMKKTASVGATMFQYFAKVVPTRYYYLNGNVLETNQFSVTQNQRVIAGGQHGLPGVFFTYDITPMKVVYNQKKKSFFHLLTNICAIVGGIFTVASIIDSFVYTAEKTLKKKMDLGKAS